jgi:hypothetical protein
MLPGDQGPVWTFGTLPIISIPDPNLVAWWTFDEGRGTRGVDWSGHGHHAGFTGAAQWVDGYDGTALSFSGQGQYLEATGYPGVLGKHERTTAAWIRTTELGDIMAWALQTAPSISACKVSGWSAIAWVPGRTHVG